MKIAICEDNEFFLEILIEYVNTIISENKLKSEVVFASNNYKNMWEFIDTKNADLYIFDVDLGSEDKAKNGIALGKQINNVSKDNFILFITGSAVNMNELFEIKAYNCLNKPLSLDYLRSIILRIHEEFSEKQNIIKCIISINCKKSNKLYIVNCSDIIYIEKKINSCLVYLNNGEIIETPMTLKEFEKECDNKLIRVHKSFLCNSVHIHTIDYKHKEITMKNGDIILIGGKYIDNLRESSK